MLSELRTLLAIARCGTFSGAGERVGLTQASVSGQMKRLEDMLGFLLFERTGRSAKLNEAGIRTVARAKDIVARFERLAETSSDDIDHPLRVGAIASVQSSILARAIARFRETYPRRRLRIVPGVSLNLLDSLDAGELDIALLIEPAFGLAANFDWQPLLHEPYALLVPRSMVGDDWRQIFETQPLIRYDRASIGGRQVDRFLRAQHLQVIESIEIDEVPALAAMVAGGLGVALAPLAEACHPLSDDVRIISLGSLTFFRTVGIARPAHGRDVAADHLVDCLLLSSAPPASAYP